MSTTIDKVDNAPDMEENADTEVDVEHKYIIKVNDNTIENNKVQDDGSIKVGSFKYSNTV